MPGTRTRSAIMLHFGRKVNRYLPDTGRHGRVVHSLGWIFSANDEDSGTCAKGDRKGLRGVASNESEYLGVLTVLASGRRVFGREFCQQLLGIVQSRPHFL